MSIHKISKSREEEATERMAADVQKRKEERRGAWLTIDLSQLTKQDAVEGKIVEIGDKPDATPEGAERLRITDDRIFTVDGPHILLFNPESGLNEVIATGEAADALANAYAKLESAEARLKEAEEKRDYWKSQAVSAENRGYCMGQAQVFDAQVKRAEQAKARAEAAEKKLSDIQHSFHRAKQVRETYRQELLRAQAALKQVEWVRAEWATCPWCDSDPNDGHKSDCARQAALSPEKKGEGSESNRTN